MSERALVEALASMQKANAWSDGEVARQLGVNRSTWAYVRQGKRRPGTRVLSGITRAFPQLAGAITLFLRDGVPAVTSRFPPVARAKPVATAGEGAA